VPESPSAASFPGSGPGRVPELRALPHHALCISASSPCGSTTNPAPNPSRPGDRPARPDL